MPSIAAAIGIHPSGAIEARHGHAGALLQNYKCRSPRIVAWARAAFEQGALPSVLMMPGLAPVLSLPGDRMFQATDVAGGHQRPAVIHAYGGAKAGMERSLGEGPLGTGKRTLDVHSPINAHARQKSKECCKHVPIKGDTAKPD